MEKQKEKNKDSSKHFYWSLTVLFLGIMAVFGILIATYMTQDVEMKLEGECTFDGLEWDAVKEKPNDVETISCRGDIEAKVPLIIFQSLSNIDSSNSDLLKGGK